MRQVRTLPTRHSAPPRLADHDAASLGSWLVDRCRDDSRGHGKGPRRLENGKRAAAKAFRVAFAGDEHGDAAWNDDVLREAAIGGWARPALLSLSPQVGLTVAERAPSSDGSQRLLLRAHDGALVESVIIPTRLGRDRARTTLCLSSQVGCARACTFCETGVQGLQRQLTAGEIVDQFRIAMRACHQDLADRPVDMRADDGRGASQQVNQAKQRRAISNIVFMGMGEPMDNFREVMRAIELLCDRHAFAFPVSRITVSTVGVADKLEAFFATTRAELAISLNAPDDARRSPIMPINERFDLQALRDALVRALPRNRRVLFQYAIFDGFNDAIDDADLLARYVRGIRCQVNVIPANDGPDPTLIAPSMQRVDAFVARLRAHGVVALLRRPRGRDVGGACGQLAGTHLVERQLAKAAWAERCR